MGRNNVSDSSLHGDSSTVHGPSKNRSCTDVICLIIFTVFMLGWISIGVYAVIFGDPSRLIHPTNSKGQKCGYDHGLENKSYLVFFDLTKCFHPDVLISGCKTPQVCVEKCPDKTFFAGLPVKNESFDRKDLICDEETDVNVSTDLENLINEGHCARYYLKSESVAYRCLPALPFSDNNEILKGPDGNPILGENGAITVGDLIDGLHSASLLSNIQEVGQRIFQDYRRAWPHILVGLLAGAIISFFFIVLMYCLAAPVIWVSLLAMPVVLGYGIYHSLWRYTSLKDSPEANKTIAEIGFTLHLDVYFQLQQTWLGFAVILMILLLILLLVLIFLRSRIRLAIALIEEGSRAVRDTMSSLTFPVMPFLLQMVAIGFFLVASMSISSLASPEYRVSDIKNCLSPSSGCKEGDLCNPDSFNCSCEEGNPTCIFFGYTGRQELFNIHIMNIFAFLWAICFLSAWGELVLAITFVQWYWSRKKSSLHYPLSYGIWCSIRYHIGTLALGSLLIALLKFIRLALEYLDYQLQKYQQNAVAKAILCCCKCCFYCLEKFLKFMNRNAYVLVAINGYSFCTAIRKTFSLVMRNVVRFAVIDKTTDFLLFLGKLTVVGIVGILSFFVFDKRISFMEDYIPETNYYLTPVFTIVIGTFFIASCFFSVYEMAIDTLFICFLEDCEKNDGSEEKPYAMPKNLMKLLGKKNKAPVQMSSKAL
ncbi:unnamed protein product [Darwinula stevensoni]|uniref:Choline transporter-like protein n=1 Tax=Darwinula stevensoni TaxID=69355 RepID=A0A7R9A559_9CRUS|nr:unnamed protein product [Darwinula stevensoni]CAG0884688.1 unnamed protein product [Darwinula stevensoni]